MTDLEAVEQLVWGVVARIGEMDEAPEVAIERTQESLAEGRYASVADFAAEVGTVWPVPEMALQAGMWAGKARWALVQRDAAICDLAAHGYSLRAIAELCGLTHPAVARVVERAGKSRWSFVEPKPR